MTFTPNRKFFMITNKFQQFETCKSKKPIWYKSFINPKVSYRLWFSFIYIWSLLITLKCNLLSYSSTSLKLFIERCGKLLLLYEGPVKFRYDNVIGKIVVLVYNHIYLCLFEVKTENKGKRDSLSEKISVYHGDN